MSPGTHTGAEMVSESYNTLCHEIRQQILVRLEKNHEKDYYFAPDGTAKKVLNHENLRCFFRSLGVQFELTEEKLAKRVIERELHSFLAVLIFTSCSIEAARTFTTRLVAKDPWPRQFWSLPVAHEKLIELFGEKVTPHQIMGQQACFCPVVIEKGKQIQVPNPKGRLPYLEQKRRAEGSFGKVYQVKICKGHFKDLQTGISNREPLILARKDYTISTEFSGKADEADHDIMKKILSCKRTSNNIVENYGILVTESTTYSLFMPLAICDLSTWLMKDHRTPPISPAEKAKIIRSAQGLADGLHFLHNGMKTDGGEELVCYHMDLKPSNILIFLETTGGEERYVWKISDFGMSRVKIRHRGHGGENERDFNRWFLRKPRPDPSLEPTRALHGEGTYLAPESISAIPSMKTGSDVWSLGCVLSVVFAYLEEGGDGVERYQEARLRHHQADSYDRFFLRDRGFIPSRVHPLVHKWHTQLIDRASQRSPDEGEAMRFILRHLEHSVLQVDQSKRCGVKEVRERLRITCEKYSGLRKPEGHDKEKQRQHVRSIMTKIRSMGHGTDSGADRPVDEWFLDAPDASKGCEISPNGDLVAFWTDTKILLYTSQSLKDRNMATVAGEYPLEADAGCFWKTVTLTDKYLIASTTGASFQCYVFDLKRGVAVDPSLNYSRRFTLPHYPKITKVAISPGSKTMACILRDEDDDQKPGSLFFAPVTAVKEGRSFGQLDWPARDVMQLSFSNEDDLYIIVRPRLTVRSRKHQIPIIHVSCRTKKLQPLIFESQGFDGGATACLFTAFASFRHKAACAVVTREKRLHIQSLVTDLPVPAVQLDFKNYRVLKLIMGRRDEKLYAIGKPSASHRMLLLEITMPGPNSEEVFVRELAQLPNLSYDAHFTERLSDEREENYVLIASLASANQRAAIHRIRLLN